MKYSQGYILGIFPDKSAIHSYKIIVVGDGGIYAFQIPMKIIYGIAEGRLHT